MGQVFLISRITQVEVEVICRSGSHRSKSSAYDAIFTVLGGQYVIFEAWLLSSPPFELFGRHHFHFFFRFMSNKTIIRFAFSVISGVINTPTWTLIILNITKTSSYNCLRIRRHTCMQHVCFRRVRKCW